jgi:RHS repeat-associated protein
VSGIDPFSVPSAGGSEVYGFDASGHHVSTKTLPTAATRLTLGYDAAGHTTSLTDVDGNVTTIQRDAAGNATAIVSPYGVTTTLDVSGGYLASVTDPTGGAHHMTYQSGLLTSIQFPTGSATLVSRKAYDSLGRITSSSDAAGHSLTFVRAPDSPSSISVRKTTGLGVSTQSTVSLSPTGASTWTNTLADGTIVQRQVNPDGSSATTDPDGTKTTYTQGPDPRYGVEMPLTAATTTTTPSGLTRSRAQARTVTLSNPTDPLSLTSETDTTTIGGQTWTETYAASTRTWTMTSPLGRRRTVTLDAAGRATSIASSGVNPLAIGYDPHGRVTSVTQGARSSSQGYDPRGYLALVTDPLGRSITLSNDLVGRPTQALAVDGRTSSVALDGDGDPTLFTLPNGQAHGFTFTPVDAIASYVAPSVGSGSTATTYGYDGDGRIASVQRPGGVTVTYTYDTAGRLQGTTTPQGTTTRAYDPKTGHLASVTAPSGESIALGYDGFLPTGATWSGPVAGAVAFGWDNNFHRTSEMVGGSSVAFAYDLDGLLTQAGALALARDAQNGRLTGTTLASTTDTYAYDADGFLASYGASYGSTPVYSEAITQRDALGRITQKSEVVAGEAHSWGYSYDPAGHLADVTEDGASVSHYGYDVNGNRTSAVAGAVTVSGTYDAQDRIVSYGATSYTHSANGERTSAVLGGLTTAYTYDALGNLLHVGLPNGTNIDYLVDGQNHRVGKKVNGTLVEGYLYRDALHPVAKVDGAGNVTARYVFGSRFNVPDYVVTPTGTYRIFSDHLGSPRVVVDTSNGNIVERIDYDEFGKVVRDTNPGLLVSGFAGGLYDHDTGLVRFGARDYDPTVGRWTTKDSARFAGGDTNLYAYAYGEPIDFVDFDGRNANPTPANVPWDYLTGSYTLPLGDTGTYVTGQLTQDRWNRWYFTFHFGAGLESKGFYVGAGRINPFDPERQATRNCDRAFNDDENFLTGPSLNANVGYTSPMGVGGALNGTWGAGGYALDAGMTVGPQGPSFGVDSGWSWEIYNPY